MSETILEISNVQKYYGNKGNVTKAINGISFELNKGEFVGIMGASGSGKTTLLNCISTIDTVTSGSIKINNQDITQLKGKKLSAFRRDNLGFIFQDFNLLDTLSGMENIALALSISNYPANKIKTRIQEIAKDLNITEVLDKYPYQMSGGQQQRIAAARAIINNPALILADEPTGALDSGSSKMLLGLLEELNQKMKASILMVTHDSFTASFCHRILFIKDGKVFSELVRGEASQNEFFRKILEVTSILGGEKANVD